MYRATLIVVSTLLFAKPSMSAPRAIQIVAGSNFNCALFDNGRVKCWGGNSNGQLGQGHNKPMGTRPEKLGEALPYLDLGDDATVVGGKALVKSLSAGGSHVCAFLTTGKLKCWGENLYGAIFLPGRDNHGISEGQMGENLPEVKLEMQGATPRLVSGLTRATCVAAGTDKVECSGYDWNGLRRLVPIPLQVFRDFDFEGRGLQRPMYPVPYSTRANLTLNGNISQLEGGESAACALFNDGKVQCWGLSDSGMLGGLVVNVRLEGQGEVPMNMINLGGAVDQLSLGDAHACALMVSGEVKCWGQGASGQLGTESRSGLGTRETDMGENLKPIDLGLHGNKVVRIRCGAKRSCAVLENGTVKCWGSLIQGNNQTDSIGDEPGEMGEALDYLPLGPLDEVQDLALGVGHGCALLKDGDVKCWGANDVGQLGVGTTRSTFPEGMGRALRPAGLN